MKFTINWTTWGQNNGQYWGSQKQKEKRGPYFYHLLYSGLFFAIFSKKYCLFQKISLITKYRPPNSFQNQPSTPKYVEQPAKKTKCSRFFGSDCTQNFRYRSMALSKSLRNFRQVRENITQIAHCWSLHMTF